MSSEVGFPLLNLAPEIVAQVVAQVSTTKDLASVRLTCKALESYARKELFKNTIFFSPAEEDSRRWAKVSQNDVIRCIPREVTIRTRSEDEEDDDYDEEDDEEGFIKFQQSLAALSKFPNVDSLQIHFTPECLGRDAQYWQEVREDAFEREKILEIIFQAIRDRAADKNNRTIRRLTIVNLQNFTLEDFTSSYLFRDVMSDLEELHISMTQEYNEAGPDHDYDCVELQTFPDHLCSAWLAPIAANLVSLSLYSRADNWGPFPGYFDPSGISFPKLEKLALGYYTIAHNNDIDWLLNIKSLRSLTLHNCMIASWMCIYADNLETWNVRTHDWERLPQTEENDGSFRFGEQFAYKGTWSMFFDRITESLPNLSHFAFDYGINGNNYGYNVNNRDLCSVKIFNKRYLCFDNGLLPTPWPEADWRGQLYSFLDDGFPIDCQKEYFDQDQKSLDRLMAGLKVSER